jgi:hypothetical protein
MINKIVISILICVSFILISCNLLDLVGSNNNDWEEEYEEETDFYSEEEDSEKDEEDDEEIPIVENGFQRDIKFTLPLFSPDSAWNQRADNAEVLPESDEQILSLYRVLLGDISSLEGYVEPATEWPYMDINLYEYSVPIFLTGKEMQEVLICEDDGIIGWAHPKFDIETEGGPVVVPAPAGTVRPAGPENEDADAWLVLYDPDTGT